MTVRIVSFPTPADDTYYFWLYYEGLSQLDYELVDTRGVELDLAWLEKNAGAVDIIHFHWPAYTYSKKTFSSFYESIKSFASVLSEARKRGYKIAWTVHNAFPHERNNIYLEYLARVILAHYTDVVFVHFDGARRALLKFFKWSNIHKIPHGNFSSVFPNDSTRISAREKLGIPTDAFVYLIFGPIRPYKGIEEGIEAFLATRTEKDVLIIAGNPSDSGLSKRIEEDAANNPSIKPILKFVEKSEVHFLFNATDIVLLPYKKIFTSGNLFLALTFGKPVIGPDMGILSEVVDESCGIKYTSTDRVSGLKSAFCKMKQLDSERLSRTALAKGKSYTWEESANISDKAFRQILSGKK